MKSPQGILSPASYFHSHKRQKRDWDKDINFSPPFTSVLYMQFGDLSDSLILIQQDAKQACKDEGFMQEKQSHWADIKIDAAIKMPWI